MTTPYADLAAQDLSEYSSLRARLAPLAAAATERPWEKGKHRYDSTFRHRNARGELVGIGQTAEVEDAAFIVALVNAYPEITALLARGEAAEADADRLAYMLGKRDDGLGIDWVDDEVLCLHDDALALRTQQS